MTRELSTDDISDMPHVVIIQRDGEPPKLIEFNGGFGAGDNAHAMAMDAASKSGNHVRVIVAMRVRCIESGLSIR